MCGRGCCTDLHDTYGREDGKSRKRLTRAASAGAAEQPGQEGGLPEFHEDPPYEHTCGEMPQVSQQGRRGKAKSQSLSFPRNKNICNFLSSFHANKDQKPTCHRGNKALARLHMHSLLGITSTHYRVISLQKGDVSHSSTEVFISPCYLQ